MDDVRAPHLCGLAPDEASRVCYGEGLALTIVVADMVEVRGMASSCVRVTEQWPSPGSRMESRSVVVTIDVVDGAGRADR